MRTRRRRVAVVVALALFACFPHSSGASGACATPPRWEIAVVVVIDFGELLPGASTSVACVVVSEGVTGAAVLHQRARDLGTPPPRYDTSGLLCALDGLPENGCGERDGDRYLYWSYWQGDGDGWTYSQVGPAQRKANPSVTEGWHFVRGAALPSDPPPRAPAVGADAVEVKGATVTAGRPSDDDGSGSDGLAGPAVGAAAFAALAGVGAYLARRRRATR